MMVPRTANANTKEMTRLPTFFNVFLSQSLITSRRRIGCDMNYNEAAKKMCWSLIIVDGIAFVR